MIDENSVFCFTKGPKNAEKISELFFQLSLLSWQKNVVKPLLKFYLRLEKYKLEEMGHFSNFLGA